jgi:IS30 family transposase
LSVTKRAWRRVDPDLRREMMRLAARGLSQNEVARRVGRNVGVVNRVLRPLGGVWRSDQQWEPSPARLGLAERIEIRVGLEVGESFTAIGRRIGRAVSTVSREVRANGGRQRYAPMDAHRRAAELAGRPKATKLATSPALCARVVADLERLWSPEQIARRLRAEHPDDATMWVSHETIYKSLYVQGRGELRRELARCLRTGRAQRRPHARMERRGRLRDMVMISERPAEAADRAVPGHWEGDLIVGENGRSAIATLVERQTRYVLLAKIADQRAETVRGAITSQITTLPEHLRRSLTWDQGTEMAQHLAFSVDTGVAVYFCDPHSPWQRGSNENTNGLLRQYFPKGTPLSGHTQQHLDFVAAQLNGRPRETLGWRTPAEKLAEVLATTG